MQRRVAVVTDSTADLPRELASRLGVSVVQLQLQVGRTWNEELRVPTEQVVGAMYHDIPVTTAPPKPETFFWAYQDLAYRGHEAIVSLHISSRMSETIKAARQAAQQVRTPVYVVDSLTTAMSLGWAVVAAAEAAEAGGDVAAVIGAAQQRCRDTIQLLYVDTLEYLRRGGRIGAARALLGTALSIKPLLTVEEGEVAPLDQFRGAERAVKKLVEFAVKNAGKRPVDIAVEHFAAPEQAEALLHRLRKKIPNAREFVATQTSTIIGIHVGPGALGVSVSPLATDRTPSRI
ncbi:DegV family protein [Gandjariella thermophila]|uniref:DegV family protein n=1 Tax=Gandjariella thermophila TaxID=1931992 RepID=UPI0010FA5F71|nr:DegV family protein [Gandjariella thermophila]